MSKSTWQTIEEKLVKHGLIFPKNTKIENETDLDQALETIEVKATNEADLSAINASIADLTTKLDAALLSIKTIGAELFTTSEVEGKEVLTSNLKTSINALTTNVESIKTETNSAIVKVKTELAGQINILKEASGSRQPIPGASADGFSTTVIDKKKETKEKPVYKSKAELEAAIAEANKQ